jgi:hypothetical protein
MDHRSNVMADGALGLLWPPPSGSRPWQHFWRRHPELIDAGQALRQDAPSVDGFCHRMTDYVSLGLYWIEPEGSGPLVFDAFASGLKHCEATHGHLANESSETRLRKTYGAFVGATIAHAARRLSLVTLAGSDSVWTPASGEPLTPWLRAQNPGVGVRCRPYGQKHAERISARLVLYTLDEQDRKILSEEPSP